ncbi:unnamed protein product, partial [Allacma fusca]|jgi:hypothetical protein
MST